MSGRSTEQADILHLGDIAFVGYKLTKLLRKHHIDADYLAYAKPWIRDEQQVWVSEFSSDPSARSNKIRVLFETLDRVNDYQVVHAHSVFAIPLLLKRTQFLLHLHGSDLRVYARQSTPLGLAIRLAVRRASSVLVSTPDLVSDVSEFGRTAIFLPNPVDFDLFREHHSGVDFHDGVDWVIFHPASHSTDKGNDVLLRAVRRLTENGHSLRLVMVEWGGSVEESKRLVHRLGLSEHVTWIPLVAPNRMAEYYNMSDIVCDQFGMSIVGMTTLEAMACSKPVVTRYDPTCVKNGYETSPPLPRLLGESDLVDTMSLLMASPEYLRDSRIRCAAWVRKEHSEERILTVLNARYEAIASGVASVD